MSRRTLLRVVAALAATGAAASVARDAHLRHLLRHGLRRAERELHHLEGALRGVRYHALGGEPDPMALDSVLADRVRSELGRLERRLDVPHVHVSVRRHAATLHGEVGGEADAAEIEKRVLQVSGIWGCARSCTPG